MTDYESMSDFEIDLAVTIAVTGLEPCYSKPSQKQRVFVAKDFDNDNFPPEIARQHVDIPCYCNNPADAWPIIVENDISIIAPHNIKPLRDAMIVFLMMKESEQ